MKRLLVTQAAQGAVTLSGDGFHHLVRVLRAQVGDLLEVFDGQGHTYSARLVSMGENEATLELGEAKAHAAARPVWVVQGLPKADKWEWVLQKGTELGAAVFWPALTAHTIVQPKDGPKKHERWQRIVDEAARQCGRADTAHVREPADFTRVLAELPPSATLVFFDEAEGGASLSAQAWPQSSAPLVLLLGPEGGWSSAEREAVMNAGAVRVSLGRRVLRTETAAIVALSLVQFQLGELS